MQFIRFIRGRNPRPRRVLIALAVGVAVAGGVLAAFPARSSGHALTPVSQCDTIGDSGAVISAPNPFWGPGEESAGQEMANWTDTDPGFNVLETTTGDPNGCIASVLVTVSAHGISLLGCAKDVLSEDLPLTSTDTGDGSRTFQGDIDTTSLPLTINGGTCTATASVDYYVLRLQGLNADGDAVTPTVLSPVNDLATHFSLAVTNSSALRFTPEFTPPPNANGWLNNGTFHLKWDVTSTLGETVTTGPECDPNVYTRVDTDHGTITCSASAAHGSNTGTATFKIDTVQPLLQLTNVSPASDSTHWSKTPVTATFSCTEQGNLSIASGIDHSGGTTYTEQIDTQGHKITFASPTNPCQDLAGNTSTPSAIGVETYIDSAAPTGPTITSDHTVGVASTSPTVNASWSGASDDGSGLAGYYTEWNSSPASLTGTPSVTTAETDPHSVMHTFASDGTYYLHLVTFDNARNTTQTDYGPIVIDTTAPSKPVVSSPGYTPGTWTTSPNLNVTWSASADSGSGVSGYRYSWNSSPTGLGTSPATTTGLVSTHTASDGAYYFHIVAFDGAGNTSAQANYGPFDVDATAPTAPTVSSSDHSVGLPSRNPTVTVNWSGANDGGSGLAGYYVEWNSSPTALEGTPSPTIPGGDPHSASHTFASDGSFYVHIVTFDVAGNSMQIDDGPFVIDTTPPSQPVVTSPDHVPGVWSTVRKVTVGWGASSDTGSGIDGYAYSWNTSPTVMTQPPTLTTALTATQTFAADGVYYFHVVALDKAGNSSAQTDYGPFDLDATAPTGPATSSPDHTVGTPSNNPTVKVNWSGASDAGSGVAGYYTEWNASPTALSGTPSPTITGDDPHSATHTFASDGSYYVHIVTFDGAGNSTQTDYGPIVIDTTAPTVTLGGSVVTNDSTPTLSGTTTEPGTVTVTVDGHTYTATVDQNQTGGVYDWSVGITRRLRDGTYTVDATAEDAAGNAGSVRLAGGLVIDTMPPSLSILSASLPRGRSSFSLSARASDSRTWITDIQYKIVALRSLSVVQDWTSLPAKDGSYDSRTESVHSTIHMSAFANGSYWIFVSAIDQAGNVSLASRLVVLNR